MLAVVDKTNEREHRVVAASEMIKAGLTPVKGDEPSDYVILILNLDQLREEIGQAEPDARLVVEINDQISPDGRFCFNYTSWETETKPRKVFTFVSSNASPRALAHCLNESIAKAVNAKRTVIPNGS